MDLSHLVFSDSMNEAFQCCSQSLARFTKAKLLTHTTSSQRPSFFDQEFNTSGFSCKAITATSRSVVFERQWFHIGACHSMGMSKFVTLSDPSLSTLVQQD